ncbi:bacteriocin [Salmonella enterica subsp. enterica serovar Lomalinda]|nr:bacteriocin [Salmonella enterica subsp. enterica serovar Lomalinda]
MTMKTLHDKELNLVSGGHAWNPWHSSTAIKSAFDDGTGHISGAISPGGAAAVCSAVAGAASIIGGPVGAAVGTAICGGVAAANAGAGSHH